MLHRFANQIQLPTGLKIALANEPRPCKAGKRNPKRNRSSRKLNKTKGNTSTHTHTHAHYVHTQRTGAEQVARSAGATF